MYTGFLIAIRYHGEISIWLLSISITDLLWKSFIDMQIFLEQMENLSNPRYEIPKFIK